MSVLLLIVESIRFFMVLLVFGIESPKHQNTKVCSTSLLVENKVSNTTSLFSRMCRTRSVRANRGF